MGSPVQQISDICPADPSSGDNLPCPHDMTVSSKVSARSCPIDDQKDILVFLGRATSYGLKTSVDRLGLVDSILYFTEANTYRIRRNRPMGYHDRIDLEGRAHLCEAEFKFGKSVSPEIYQCLRPILRDGDALQLGPCLQQASSYQAPTGLEVADWLVQMQRYDYNQTFDKVGGLEDLSLEDCNGLAQYLVDLHSWSSSYDREDWEDWLGAHLASFDKRPQLFAPQPGLRGLKASLDQAHHLFAQLKPLLKERAHHGQVQALHGNLRLANILAHESGPKLINPRLMDGLPQRGDCLFDLAGLLIDLWSQGMRGQSNWVFSRYFSSLLDNSNLDGLRALGLMMFVRSIDRALAICPSDKACESGARCSLASAFEDFVRLAMESLFVEHRILVVLAGPDCEAKTEFAQLLSPALGRMPGGLWLSASHEKALLDPGGQSDARHQTGLSDMVHEYMLEKARFGLEADFSVLVDWSGSHPACLKAMTQFADSTNAYLVPIWFEKPQSTDDSVRLDGLASEGWSMFDPTLDMEALLHKAHGLLGKICERPLPEALH